MADIKKPFRINGLGLEKAYASDAAYLAATNDTPRRGDVYFNTASLGFRYFDGSSWRDSVSQQNRLPIAAFDNVETSVPSGVQTIDGYSTAEGDLVLLVAVPSPGVYVVESGTWTLAGKLQNPTGLPQAGDKVYVINGTLNSRKEYVFDGISWIEIGLGSGSVEGSILSWAGAAWAENSDIITNGPSISGFNDESDNDDPAGNLLIKGGDKSNTTDAGSYGDPGSLTLSGGTARVFEAYDYTESTETTLPTSSPLIIGGDTVQVGDKVHFTNLSVDPGVYELLGDSPALSWDYIGPYEVSETKSKVYIEGSSLNINIQLASDPATGAERGDLYYNTVSELFRFYNGTSWEDLGSGGSGGSGEGLVKVRLYDPVTTDLSSGPAISDPFVVDGETVLDGDLVLFSNLNSDNNRVYSASISSGVITWTAEPVFNEVVDPTVADLAIVEEGQGFALQVGKFSGSTWLFNDKVRYFNGTDYWEQSSLNAVALLDNQSTPQEIFAVGASGSENIIIHYSILRGSTKDAGMFVITHDGTNVGIGQAGGSIGSTGILLSADIDSGDVRWLYTSSNTGADAVIKYTVSRWSDAPGGPGNLPSYSVGGSSVTGSGASGRIAFWDTASNIISDADLTYDAGNNIINHGGLEKTGLESLNLLDNTSGQVVFAVPHANYKHFIVKYSFTAGSNSAVGIIVVTTNGTSASQAPLFTDLSGTPVTFTADITGANVRLLANTAANGSAGELKYSIERWS